MATVQCICCRGRRAMLPPSKESALTTDRRAPLPAKDSRRSGAGLGSMHGSVRWGKRMQHAWRAESRPGPVDRPASQSVQRSLSLPPLSSRSFKGDRPAPVSLLRVPCMEVSAFPGDRLMSNSSSFFPCCNRLIIIFRLVHALYVSIP